MCKFLSVTFLPSRYESTRRNSKVMKNMVFQFFSSYINLLIYSFLQLDFDKVATQMGSMMISKNLINILTVIPSSDDPNH